MHVVAGPDHLAAVAPFSSRSTSAAAVGFRWGVGHSLGVLLVGFLALIFRDLIPLEALSGWSERLVGVTLVAVGLWGLRLIQRERLHTHEHEHGPVRHAHPHCHFSDASGTPHHPAEAGDGRHRHSHAAWAIGVLHGCAGSSHLFGVLPAMALPTAGQAAMFLSFYGVGSIVTMTLFAAGIGRLASTRWLTRFNPHLAFGTCSVAAVMCGAYWLLA